MGFCTQLDTGRLLLHTLGRAHACLDDPGAWRPRVLAGSRPRACAPLFSVKLPNHSAVALMTVPSSAVTPYARRSPGGTSLAGGGVGSGSVPGLGAAAAGAASGSGLRHSPDTPLSTTGAARQPSDCGARAPWSAAAASTLFKEHSSYYSM